MYRFFSVAGPEFDEVFVGQGAKRVRELFNVAKERAPCVIFIDEIDSVGSTRKVSHQPHAHQTINQLLSEMDGFQNNGGVIVIGATNRAEDLDKALTRPGRFDSKIPVILPDKKGRKSIIEYYLSKITHDHSVDVEVLAGLTTGMAGAHIQNLINTAAIRAASINSLAVTMLDLQYALDKITLGTDWKSRERKKADLKLTAYHEAGHTLVCLYTEDANPLHKVTIVAKGQSGGHTAMLPHDLMDHETKSHLNASLDVSMGGRAAEEIIFGKEKVTTGASSDMKYATDVAEAMVKKFGMSEKQGLRFVNEEMSTASMEVIDSEVNRLLKESYQRAMNILTSRKKELHLLAEALLEHETLDVQQIKAVLEGQSISSLKPKPHNRGYNNNTNNPSSNSPLPTPFTGVPNANMPQINNQ